MALKVGWNISLALVALAALAGFGIHRAWVSDPLADVPEVKPSSLNADAGTSVVANPPSLASFPPPVSADSLSVEAQLDELRRQLLEEQQARQKLASELAALGRELEDLRAGAGASAHTLGGLGDVSPPSEAFMRANEPGSVTTMVALGFSEERASQLKKRIDKFSLDRLKLWDSATREGWLDSERYRKELGQIEADESGFRSELGEEEYDRMLYALGESNRVAVQEVMLGSAAAGADLQVGDLVLTYDGRRIFKFDDLRTATVEGIAGELVEVTVERNESLQTVFIPRGPLGVRLDSARVLP